MQILSILNLASLPLTTPLLFQIFRIPAVQSGRDGQVLVQPSGPSDAEASGRARRKRRSRLRVAGPGFQKERKLHQKRVFELVRKHFFTKISTKGHIFLLGCAASCRNHLPNTRDVVSPILVRHSTLEQAVKVCRGFQKQSRFLVNQIK